MWCGRISASTNASFALSAKRLTESPAQWSFWIMNALFGGPYSTHAKRVAIWSRAAPIPGCDKAIWRCDDQGRIIRWSDYEDRFSRYGWTILRGRGEGRILSRPAARPVHVSQADQSEAAPVRKAA
jgi:hypothetical protein